MKAALLPQRPEPDPMAEYLRSNYATATLSSMAGAFHYSGPHLSALIKRRTGQNFTALVRQARMAQAAALLEDTHLQVAQVAQAVGYRSADGFSRVFKHTYGLSPREYRREKR